MSFFVFCFNKSTLFIQFGFRLFYFVLRLMQNPLDVEDFLQENFPSHEHLRLFAENFVMTNDKYAKRPPDEKGGPPGEL